jgi:hypothetical protein
MEERRRFPRYSILSPVGYRSERYGYKEDSVTINFSEVGAMISTTKRLDITTNLIIRFVLRGEEFFIRGRVVHIQKGPDERPFKIGVEFMERPYEFIKKFHEELETIILYQKQYEKETGSGMPLSEASARWYRNSRDWM